MFNKYFRTLSWIFRLIPVLAVIFVLAGCTDGQSRKEYMRRMSLAGGTRVQTPTARNAYVLSMVPSSAFTPVQPLSTTSRSSTRSRSTDGGYTQPASTNTYGSPYFGVVSIISIEDTSNLNADGVDPATGNRTPTQLSITMLNDSAGVTGFTTRSFQFISGVTKDAFIDVLPDGRSLLASSQDDSAMYQLILDENGAVKDQHRISLTARSDVKVIPKRFAASGNFALDKNVYVATNLGVATINFSGLKGHQVGALQYTSGYNPQSGFVPYTRVFDIAISNDNQTAYMINDWNKVLYRSMDDLNAQYSSGIEQSFAEQGYKLAVAPMNVSEPVKPGSVAFTTSNSIKFTNLVDKDVYCDWQKIGFAGRPSDIEFHPDGQSVLVLTSSNVMRVPIHPDRFCVEPVQGIYVGSGATEMAMDKRSGNFIAIATNRSVTFCTLEKGYGIVNPPGDADVVKLNGDPVSISVR